MSQELVYDQGCKLPPTGWWCSRAPGHDGPCAARETGSAEIILAWYRALPEAARQTLSLRDLHKLAQDIRQTSHVDAVLRMQEAAAKVARADNAVNRTAAEKRICHRIGAAIRALPIEDVEP